ncbi:NAD(P)-dependent oxidoreductase [Chloroflexota bacterium]
MNIGFIGVGTMGGAMAANILKAGYTLCVNDVRREVAKPLLDGGASWGDTPKAVAESSDIVFTSLPGPKEIEAVVLGKDGIIDGIRPGAVYIDVSTNSPQLIRHIYNVFKEKGAHVMDVPVTGGGPKAAQAGRSTLLVGGDKDILEKCRPVLDVLAAKINYNGGIGNGTICKLMNNCIAFCVQSVIAECFTAGVKAGVDPTTLWRSIKEGTLKGTMINRALPDTYFRGRFDPPVFAQKLAFKDLNLATSLGRDVNVPMAIANIVQQDFVTAQNRGWSDKDVSMVMLIQEERAGGVEGRIPDADIEEDEKKASQ